MITETKEMHVNIPQLLCFAVQAQDNMLLWGRGTGKTEKGISMFSLNNVLSMPRSNGAFVGTTYEQILTRTLPVVIAGWEQMGYYHGIHFFVKRFPPEKYRWPKAYRSPLKPDHYISWFNGSGIYLVSQDRMGTSNGLSIDWVAGDEAKFLNYSRLKEELLLTLRGNLSRFGHLSNHYSTMFASDKSRNSKAAWMEEQKDKMDESKVKTILKIQQLISNEPSKANIYAKTLNHLRKGLTYYSEASTLDNIHALGVDAIKNWHKALHTNEFNLSVLNKNTGSTERLYYSTFDAIENTYEAPDYGHIDEFYNKSIADRLTPLHSDFFMPENTKRDCRWDKDINSTPLYIACDYNAAISNLVVGQRTGNNIKVIKNLYVESPKILKDLALKFHNYYKYLGKRKVYYIYDHTAVAKSAASQTSFSEEFRNELKKHGWSVRMLYIGQQPSHGERYKLFNEIFSLKHRLSVWINRSNCKDLINVLEEAPVKEGRSGFEKDKSSEKDASTPPIKATHITDAFDTLIVGMDKTSNNISSSPSGNL